MRAKEFTAFDRLLVRVHRTLFIRRPIVTFLVAFGVYAGGILLFDTQLRVSSNYLVILPVIAASLGWGIPGGLVAGGLGLPCNLLLFAITGHPEHSPESKVIAEMSGLVIGSSMGYLSEYFRKLDAESRKRVAIEEDLRRALREKEVLFKEVHHRVKNNLAVIKSLIHLQASRSDVPGFRESSEQLKGRIYSISLIHELLYVSDDISRISTDTYVETLIRHIMNSQDRGKSVELSLDVQKFSLSLEYAVPLGLIINEICTNALVHAFGPSTPHPSISVSLSNGESKIVLDIRDNGKGFSGPVKEDERGLGLKLIPVLVDQLQGESSFTPQDEGGTRFLLSFAADSTLP